jgi:hypothetical protein
MPRYSESREKFPIHVDLPLTREQKRRAEALAVHQGVSRNEAIRRSIDAQYLTILLPNSTDQTIQPESEQTQ